VSCDFSPAAVHGYFDGELDAVRAADFERHLEVCTECRNALEQMESLRRQIRRSAVSEQATPQFREQIIQQLGLARNNARRAKPGWRWLLVPAFGLITVAAVFWAALALVQPHTNSARITAELIDAHVRSLQPGHLTDVISTDQHTVKPWFDGKLDFIPPVTDFSDQGFPLQGGRLDVVDGHNVAALIYGRRKHTINVFVWPDKDSSSLFDSSGSRNGYNWIRWKSGDMRFCIVSDASVADLRELKDLIHP
jgi:anti-sigma factor RsiW